MKLHALSRGQLIIREGGKLRVLLTLTVCRLGSLHPRGPGTSDAEINVHSTLQITQSCPVPSLKPGAVQSTYFPAFSDTRLISAFPFHSTSFSSQFSSNINPERPSGSPQTHKKSVDKIKDTENLPFLSAAQRL